MEKIPNHIQEEAENILYLLKKDYARFSSKYDKERVGIGDRQCDGEMYEIDLSDGYFIFIETKDFSLFNYKIENYTRGVPIYYLA